MSLFLLLVFGVIAWLVMRMMEFGVEEMTFECFPWGNKYARAFCCCLCQWRVNRNDTLTETDNIGQRASMLFHQAPVKYKKIRGNLNVIGIMYIGGSNVRVDKVD